jgi:hypothetical protein
MRSKYETPLHLVKEGYLREDLERYWGRKLFKLHWYQKLDFGVLKDGLITGWVEVKHRYMKNTPTDIHLSLNKWIAGQQFTTYTGLPFIFVIRLNDGVDGDWMFVSEKNSPNDYNYIVGGRTVKQRDRQDIEPIIALPFRLFKKIGERVGGYDENSDDWNRRLEYYTNKGVN